MFKIMLPLFFILFFIACSNLELNEIVCSSDSNCPKDAECIAGKCKLKEVNTNCTEDKNCEKGEFCNNGKCEKTQDCRVENFCSNNETCNQDGKCISKCNNGTGCNDSNHEICVADSTATGDYICKCDEQNGYIDIGANGKCEKQEACENNNERCDPLGTGKIQVCNGGNWEDKADNCNWNEECNDTDGTPKCVKISCGNEGDLKCTSNNERLLRCDVDGSWKLKKNCEASGKVCNNDTSMCEDVLVSCGEINCTETGEQPSDSNPIHGVCAISSNTGGDGTDVMPECFCDSDYMNDGPKCVFATNTDCEDDTICGDKDFATCRDMDDIIGNYMCICKAGYVRENNNLNSKCVECVSDNDCYNNLNFGTLYKCNTNTHKCVEQK